MQILTVDDQTTTLVVTQSNRLIESRYSLTVGEQRLVLAMISLIHPDDEDFKPYVIQVSELARFLDIDQKSAYREIDKITSRIMGRVLDIPLGGSDWLKTHWVSSARYSKGTVTLSFDPTLRPFLLQLKERFTKYRLNVVTQFRSIHTIRLYGLLKQYEVVGYRVIDIAELRGVLGFGDDKYALFKDLRKWVLDKVKKEFESHNKDGSKKSDITFDIETIKEGRKVAKLRFNIRKQTHQVELPMDMCDAPASHLHDNLRRYGISERDADAFISEHGHEAVAACVALYERRLAQGRVKDSSGAYLASLIRRGAGATSPYQMEQDARDRRAAEAAQKRADQQRIAETLKAEFSVHLKQQAEAILDGLSESEREQHFADFVASDALSGRCERRQYEKVGQQSPAIQAMFRQYLRERYLPAEAQDLRTWAKGKGYAI